MSNPCHPCSITHNGGGMGYSGGQASASTHGLSFVWAGTGDPCGRPGGWLRLPLDWGGHAIRATTSVAPTYGCTPIDINAFLTFISPGRFIFNKSRVAWPSGVKPETEIKSSLQAKCTDHSSLRGLKRETFWPDSGSGHSICVHLKELHPSQA